MPTESIDEASRRAYAEYLKTRSFGSLDGLRAVSIVAVLWHHSVSGTGLGLRLAARGFLGVDLFFVISGFLIVTLLLREHGRTGQISLRKFYARRFLRIFPVYYAILALAGVASVLRHTAAAAAIRHDLPYAFLYISNMVPMASFLAITWSLSAEEQFYLVIPTLEKFARRQLVYLLAAIYILSCLPALGLFSEWHLPAFFRETTFGPILLGVMLAHILNSRRGYGLFWRVLRHRLSPVFAVLVTLLACSHPADDISGWPRMGIHWALVLLLASCVVREEHTLSPVFKFWPIRRIGVVSYGIYLFHHPVLDLLQRGFSRLGIRSDAVSFIALCFVAWGVAEASYRLYESRFLALKSRLT